MPISPLDVKNIWQLLAFALVMLPTTIAAIYAAYVGVRNQTKIIETKAEAIAARKETANVRAELIDANQKIEQNTELTLKIEKSTNSMKDALVASTDRAARAEGNRQGVADEKARADAVIAAQAQPLAKPPADVTDSSHEEPTPAKKKW
jgi:hypothetical protein